MKNTMSGCESCLGNLEEYMLSLLRLGVLGEAPSFIRPSSMVDWESMMDIASSQGVLAWVWDGICKLPKENQPPRLSSINWGLSAQEIWDRYYHHKRVVGEILDICNQNGIRMLLFKGLALSQLYPKPESRPSGDIDFYLFDDYERGDKLFAHSNVTRSSKRTGFDYQGVHVENHRLFLNPYTQQQRNAIAYLQRATKDAIQTKEGYYVMTPISDIVYQVMHFMAHLDDAVSPPSLRIIVDFGVTLRSYKNVVSVAELKSEMDALGITNVFCLLTSLAKRILNVDFGCYYIEIPKDDLDAVIKLAMSRSDSFKPLIERNFQERVSYYRGRCSQLNGLFKYLPYSKPSFILRSMKELFSLSVRRLFKMSNRISYGSAIKKSFGKKHPK